jgi:endonuclease G
MPFQHFSQERITELADCVIDVLGYDGPVRGALLMGIPRRFAATLSGAGNPPAIAVLRDLDRLNAVDRLVDGSIPLKTWLRNATRLASGDVAADPLRVAYEEVEIRSTGSPRIVVTASEVKEVVIHHDDMVPFAYMKAGLAAAQSVAKLSVQRHVDGMLETNRAGDPLIYLGTGWLIGDGLLLTNHHVINAREDGEAPAKEADLKIQAQATVALFDYDSDGIQGSPVKVAELVAWDASLDYALLRLESASRPPLRLGGKLVLTGEPDENIAVNIIQHPDGQPKKFGIRNNLLTATTDTELRYFTDTMGGSSGSPVFTDQWLAVGLHRGATQVKGVKFNGRDVAYVNVGTQVSAITQDLANRFAGKIPELHI